MSYRFSNDIVFKKFLPGPFWAVMYLSWPFAHWYGSDLIFGWIFSGTIVAFHICIWSFVYQRYFNEIAMRFQTEVSLTIYMASIVTHILNIPLLITTWMIRGRKRVRHFISAIETVDERLSKFGINTRKKFIDFKWLVIVVGPLVGMLILLREPVYTYHDLEVEHYEVFIQLLRFWGQYDIVIASYVLYFFVYLTWVVDDRYRIINSLLENITDAEYGDEYIAGNGRRVTLAEWIATVRGLRALHRKLFFAAEKISQAFGLQILQITLLTLLSFIGDLYQYHVSTKLPCGQTTSGITTFLLPNIFRLIPIFVAAFQGDRTIARAKRTIIVLHDTVVSDDTLRMEVATFSLQLIHYDFRFSACGFFDIDLSVIHMIAGTIVTYLIILIQIGTLPKRCRGISDWANRSQNNATEFPDIDNANELLASNYLQ
ncbi:putative gustatory receptor 28b [Athalia rosae]|uniref:putative gustatory receptor 28b n=1 Tax=Athalia rosae TaxID=37344 RepID=UPI002033FE98|nr:putative gustatory receptor 28b [Athalia rosae]